MDTTWFAVDREGHVGVFQSGEPGAVPKASEAFGQQDEIELMFEDLEETGEPSFQTSAVFHPGQRKGVEPPRRRLPMGWPSVGDACLLLFHDKSAIPAAVRALPGVQVRTLGPYVLVALKPNTKLPNDHPQAVIWNDFVRSTYKDERLVTATTLGLELGLARRGVFAYQAHDARFNLPEPYGRVLRPREPLHVRDLPKALRDQLSRRPQLDVDFTTSRYVQPAELVPCITWSSAIYLASDGFTVKALPGKEADYDNEAGCLDEDENFEPLVFESP